MPNVGRSEALPAFKISVEGSPPVERQRREKPSTWPAVLHHRACPTRPKVANWRQHNGLELMYENAINSIGRELRNEDGIANELDYIEQVLWVQLALLHKSRRISCVTPGC